MRKYFPIIALATLITLFVCVLQMSKKHSCVAPQMGLITPEQVELIQEHTKQFDRLRNDSTVVSMNFLSEVIMLSPDFSQKLDNKTIPWKHLIDSLNTNTGYKARTLLPDNICKKLCSVNFTDNLIIVRFCDEQPISVIEIDGDLLEIERYNTDGIDSTNSEPEEKKPERNYGNQKVAQLVR
jgi:hypothetical protein